MSASPPTARRSSNWGSHPFKEARFEIWAPKEDTADYYGNLQPLSLTETPAGAAAGAAVPLRPFPPGRRHGRFLQPRGRAPAGVGDNILAIDKAANNTSLVFSLEWRGWRLLFPGDAEQKSWKTDGRPGVLKPVHLLKVAHHGSENGTPQDAPFDR